MPDEVISVEFEQLGIPDMMKQVDVLSREIAKLPRKVTITFTTVSREMTKAAREMSTAVQKVNREWKSSGTSVPFPAALTADDRQSFSASKMARAHKLYGNTFAEQKKSNSFAVGTVKSGNQSIAQALKNAIFSTRFSMQNGHVHFMPLIGRTMQALSSIGPFGTAIASTTVGLTALYGMANMAADRLGRLGSAQNTSGASFSETGQLSGAAGAMGMSAQEAAASARELGERLSQGGQATAFGQRYGINDPFGENQFGGTTDKAKNWMAAVRAIAEDPSLDHATRAARAFGPGLEKALDLRYLTPEHRKMALDSYKDMFSEEGKRAAAEHTFAMSRLSHMVDRVVMGFSAFLDVIDPVINWIGKFGYVSDKTANEMMNPLGHSGAKSAEAAKKSAQDEHTKATKANTEAVWAMVGGMRGVFGGGERANSAMPANMRGQTWEQGMKAHAIGLGAFGI